MNKKSKLKMLIIEAGICLAGLVVSLTILISELIKEVQNNNIVDIISGLGIGICLFGLYLLFDKALHKKEKVEE